MHCDANVTELQTELDRLRVHLFLVGLDPEFDQVQGEILCKDPKLDIDQTFAYVRPQLLSGEEMQPLWWKQTYSCWLLRIDWWDHSKAPRKNKSKSLNTSSDSDPDILSSKTIGCDTSKGKLYYLDLASDSEASLNQAYKIGGASVEKQISKNGVAERKNRHLLEVVRASLFGANMPRPFWGEAVLSAAYLTNRIPFTLRHQHFSNFLFFFPPESFQPERDRSHVESYWSPMTLSEKDRSQLENDWSRMTLPENYRSQLERDRLLPENQPQPDPSSLCCQTQEKEADEILPTSETSSTPEPHQSPAKDVIQIPKRKNRGKPPVHYETDLNAKGKYLINNYISLNRLSESRAHFVK
ncbi:unnamed protein product, partial [Prunus brigantina]